MRQSILLSLLLLPLIGVAQDRTLFQTDFPPSEFKERREKVFDAIGKNIAVVQGAPAVDGFRVFRQTNEFYHLCGVETPQALLLLDGRSRKASLYLPHRDEARERNEGKMLDAEDADTVKALTGIDQVYPLEIFASNQIWSGLVRLPAPAFYTPLSPAEGVAQSRDEALGGIAAAASDPWDERPSREGHFVQLLRERFPTYEIRDLTPILDELRLVKSPLEIAMIRRASEIAGLGLLEAMRSTKPGVYEYQLDAAAHYVFLVNGARYEAYNSITAGGTNAWMGHYFYNADKLKSGDMVLMDYAPDYRYYSSDITRMWPINGTYTPDQRSFAEFILAYRNALIGRIKPGVTPQQVLEGARAEMEGVLKKTRFTKEYYRKAAEGMFTFRGHLSHPVGMTVHDVGNYWKAPFRVGQVFSIDPMLWVPEEHLYVRMEDVVGVTQNGAELFTDFLPSTPDEIQKVMKEQGVVQLKPPQQINHETR